MIKNIILGRPVLYKFDLCLAKPIIFNKHMMIVGNNFNVDKLEDEDDN
jgi:hypothetical protein